MEPIHLTPAPEDAGTRIDCFLASHLDGVTRSAAQKLLEGGAVQVNGKVKARIKVPAAIENADAIAAAKAEPAVAEAIAGKTIAKEIYVKGKLVNIAVKG